MRDKAGESRLAAFLPDLLLIAGWASVSAGAWMLHPAAGAIVAGVLLMAAGVIGSRKAAR